MASTAPQSCQAKLGICVHRGSFQNTLLRVEKLANEGIVQLGLPLLDECEFKATKIRTACKKREWGPDEQVLVFAPKAKGQFRLDQAIMGELFVLAGATVLPIKYVVECRPNIELGLKIVDVCEAYVHTFRQEKSLGKELVRFQG